MMAREMLQVADMLGDFWGEVVVTAVYILNPVPTCSLKGRTHMRYGMERNLQYITCVTLDVWHM
jgi:K+-transporting ATPase A subunit